MIELEFYSTETSNTVEVENFQLDTYTYTFDIEKYRYQNIEHYKIILSEEDWNTVEENISWYDKGFADYGVTLKEDETVIFRGLIQKKDVKTNHKTGVTSIITYSFLQLFELYDDLGATAGDYDGRSLPFRFETFKYLIATDTDNYNHIQIADSMPHTITIQSYYPEALTNGLIDWDKLKNDSLNGLPDKTSEGNDWINFYTVYMGYFFADGDVVKLIVYANTVARDNAYSESCYSVEYKCFYILNKTFLLEGYEGNFSSDPILNPNVANELQGVNDVLNNFGAEITGDDITRFDTFIFLNNFQLRMPFDNTESNWDQYQKGFYTYDPSSYYIPYLPNNEIEIVIDGGELIPSNFVCGMPPAEHRKYNIWKTLKDFLHILNLKLDMDHTTNPPTVITKDMNEATESEEISSSDIVEKNTSYTNIEYKEELDLLGDSSFLLEKLNGTSEIKKQISLRIISDDYDLNLGEKVIIDNVEYLITSTSRDIAGHTKDIEVLEL